MPSLAAFAKHMKGPAKHRFYQQTRAGKREAANTGLILHFPGALQQRFSTCGVPKDPHFIPYHEVTGKFIPQNTFALSVISGK